MNTMQQLPILSVIAHIHHSTCLTPFITKTLSRLLPQIPPVDIVSSVRSACIDNESNLQVGNKALNLPPMNVLSEWHHLHHNKHAGAKHNTGLQC